MIGKAKIIVQAPVKDRNTVEKHMRAQFPFQTGIHIIAEALFEILAYRAAGIAFNSFKNV